ncbi:hypothetical protein PIB30_008419 [Stylosanthes scabra]|uniref:Uncharacterized protein n=1 Tax=Stylosanthes scabra TaxID=79078 RepID=A0ABU6W2X6_9FABA|nr:hypothetical protein [Stylosanthes scabra]
MNLLRRRTYSLSVNVSSAPATTVSPAVAADVDVVHSRASSSRAFPPLPPHKHTAGRRHRVWQRAASREVTFFCCYSRTAPEVLCSLHGQLTLSAYKIFISIST